MDVRDSAGVDDEELPLGEDGVSGGGKLGWRMGGRDQLGSGGGVWRYVILPELKTSSCL